LAKKNKPSSKKTGTTAKQLDLEKSPYFAVVVFTIIFVILLILFGKFIFSDKMLFGSDTINAGLFFRELYIDYFAEHGSIPRWNPYIFGGMPYIEAFHGDIFYPLSVLKFFGKLYWKLGFNLFLHVFLAGIFMYMAARRFRLSKVSSLLSAVCYMFAPYFMSFIAPGHDGKMFVTALFPLVIFFLESGFDDSFRKSFFNFTMLGLVIGFVILSPHAQMSYFTLWGVALYALFKLIFIFKDKKTIVPLIRPATLTVYAVVIGLLLSAIQFYPGYVYTTHFSPRADAKRGWDWATSWSMHEEEAFSLLIPEFSGVSSHNTDTYYWGKNPFKDNSEAVGTISFFMALLGFLFYRRRESYFFGGLAIFALIYALGATTPIFKLLYYIIPKVKSLRAPSMIMFMFSFSSALLAGMGLQYIINRKGEGLLGNIKKLNYLLFGFPALMLLLALLFSTAGKGMLSLWTSLFYSDASRLMVQKNISKLDLAFMNLPQIQTGAWFAFLAVALVSLFIWLYVNGRMGRGILLILILVPILNGCRFNNRFISVIDPAQHFSSNRVVEFLKSQPGKFRVENFDVLPQDFLPYHKIEVFTGYHGNQLRWYDEILGGPALTNRANPRFLNLAGVKYLIFSSQAKIPDNYFGEKPLQSVMDFGSGKIMKNDNAFPRVYLAGQYRIFENRKMIYPELLNGSENMRQIVYLEKEPPLEIVPNDTLAGDSAWFIDYQIDSVLIGAECMGNKLLVLTDNYFDAWHVYIDGQPAELLRSYGTFRAVAVPEGSHRILLKFKSERYALAKTVTWLTSVYLLIIIAFYLIVLWYRKKGRKVTV